MARYVPGRPLWDHQRRALDLMRGRDAFALLMAMRTGKTPTTLADFGRLELSGHAQDLIVIAPGGAYRTWAEADDAGRLTGGAMAEHLSEDLRGRIRVHVWSARDGARRTAVLDDFMAERRRPRALLVNVEAFASVRRAREMAHAFVKQRASYAVVDEATKIKGHRAERAKFCVDMIGPYSDYRRILSGLLTPRSPLDAYMPFEFLGERSLGFSSIDGMRAQYMIRRMLPKGPARRLPDGSLARDEDGEVIRRVIPVFVGHRRLDDLQRRIAGLSYRVRLEDCSDIPERMYLFREVEMHPDQRRIYDELLHFATAQLGEQDFVTVSQVVTQMLRLHQVLCGHTTTEDGRLVEVPETRTEETCDLLEEHEGKSVIWCAYDYNVRKTSEAIARRFSEGGTPAKVARFWGGNRNTREAEEKMFKEDPACRHMVATPDAGGMARTWNVADLSVYHSCRPNLEHRMQSEERVMRVGAGGSVGYVDLRCRGTVEERFVRCLRDRINMSTVINGDDYKEWLI